MEIAALRLRQRDGVTCGPTVAVVAGALLDVDYRSRLESGAGRLWFDAEQARVHADVNRIWPRRLGTTPLAMARALSAHQFRYRWRLVRRRRDPMADVVRAVDAGLPVPMLIGRFMPRHWVLLIDRAGGVFRCYEPSSGTVVSIDISAIRRARLVGLGYPRPFAFVRPVAPR